VGTLSKALGSMGGFVAASSKVVDLVINRARSFIFSTAQPEAISAAGIAALKIVETEPWRRKRVTDLANEVRLALEADGWNVGNSESPIIPVIVGEENEAVRVSDALRNEGIFVPAIRPPATPPGHSLVRISLSAAHSDEQVEKLLAAFKHCRAKC
jgi:7-keto-8-aminopelargonate synthetase-like enzyme